MKLAHYLMAAAIATPALAAQAAPITLDFEGVESFSSVGDFYNGGTDGAGNSGTDYGVSFTSSGLGLSNDALGDYFSNAPTPGSILFATDDALFMNVAAGFADYASFFYSSSVSAPLVVNIYSGLNGTGSVLGSFSLNLNAQAGCNDTMFCNFEKTSVVFAGIGHSIGFGATAGTVGFDNVVLNPVPEPSTYALLAFGLAGIGLATRRRAA